MGKERLCVCKVADRMSGANPYAFLVSWDQKWWLHESPTNLPSCLHALKLVQYEYSSI